MWAIEAHHDLDEAICDEVQAGELGDVERELDDLRERVERAGLDDHDDRTAVFGPDVLVVAADVPRDVPDAARYEEGDEHVVRERERVLRRREAGEVGDEDRVAGADGGQQGCRCLLREDQYGRLGTLVSVVWKRTARPKAEGRPNQHVPR